MIRIMYIDENRHCIGWLGQTRRVKHRKSAMVFASILDARLFATIRQGTGEKTEWTYDCE